MDSTEQKPSAGTKETSKENKEAGPSIGIVLNGEPRSVPAGQNIEQLLRFLEIDPSRVAVEYNRAILSKTLWVTTLLQPDDQFEIVWFVGGG